MVYDEKLLQNSELNISRLLEIMRTLRHPEHGCSWDIKQDFTSIAPYIIEEAYEVVDAIEEENWNNLEAELGDLLLQIVYQAQIATEAHMFTFNDLTNAVSEKMIARHPHIFGNEQHNKSDEQVNSEWEDIKAVERASKDKPGVLDDVALALPALLRAKKLQKRAARVGFDWPGLDFVLNKIKEEIDELADARNKNIPERIEEEFGDLLFVLVNFGRHIGVDAEEALRTANKKFVRRFEHIEHELAKLGKSPEKSSLIEMDSLWNDAKKKEKQLYEL